MELDDFKNKNFAKTTNENESGPNDNSVIDHFIESFKANIKVQRKKAITWALFLVILGLLYISKSVFYSSGNGMFDNLTSIGFGLSTIGFILGAIYLYFRYRSLPDSFYGMPVLDFINKAEKNLNFMNLIDWLIIIPLLLILGTGGGIILITRLLNYTDNLTALITIWVVFFVSLSIFGFFASKKNWKKEHGQLFKEFQEFKKAMGDNENN
jgi:hypothetical protein